MSVSQRTTETTAQATDQHRVRVLVEVELDADFVQGLAERSGQRIDHVLNEIAFDIECRTHDACRWRHGVRAVRVRS
jgi:hypothetical protein